MMIEALTATLLSFGIDGPVKLAQFGIPSDMGQAFWFLLIMGFIFLYPKLMVMQVIWKLEKDVEELQRMTDESVQLLAENMQSSPDKELVGDIDHFLDFFVSPPIDIDPQGLVPKMDKMIKEQFDTFDRFVEEHSELDDEVQNENLKAALVNTVGQNQITKIVRHFLGLIKKYRNPQIAMLIQMQIPMIKEIARAINRSVENLANGEPVGDGVGPLAAARLIGHKKYEEVGDTDMVYATRKIGNRDAVIVKAKGPGANIGYPGDALLELIEEHDPARIITIDAASKLEGEETGTVAEGVGFAMNPQLGGPQRYEVEEVAAEKEIPLEGVIVKMSSEESLYNMKEEIYEAVPQVVDIVEDHTQLVGADETVIIVGVGNTCGVGNNANELDETEEELKEGFRKNEEIEKKKEEEKPFWERTSTSAAPQHAVLWNR